MKEKFEATATEIVRFETEDIIRTSAGQIGGGNGESPTDDDWD